MKKAFVSLCLLNLVPKSVWACSVCFGQADAKTMSALKWGMASLLAVVAFILSLVIVFIIQFNKRAKLMKI